MKNRKEKTMLVPVTHLHGVMKYWSRAEVEVGLRKIGWSTAEAKKFAKAHRRENHSHLLEN